MTRPALRSLSGDVGHDELTSEPTLSMTDLNAFLASESGFFSTCPVRAFRKYPQPLLFG